MRNMSLEKSAASIRVRLFYTSLQYYSNDQEKIWAIVMVRWL